MIFPLILKTRSSGFPREHSHLTLVTWKSRVLDPTSSKLEVTQDRLLHLAITACSRHSKVMHMPGCDILQRELLMKHACECRGGLNVSPLNGFLKRFL